MFVCMLRLQVRECMGTGSKQAASVHENTACEGWVCLQAAQKMEVYARRVLKTICRSAHVRLHSSLLTSLTDDLPLRTWATASSSLRVSHPLTAAHQIICHPPSHTGLHMRQHSSLLTSLTDDSPTHLGHCCKTCL